MSEHPEPEPGRTGDHQRVDQGAAVHGNVQGDVNLTFGAATRVVKPRFREGPYPAEDISERLHAFVEPPSCAAARAVLDRRRVLLLIGAAGSGAGTAAFALLRDRITGDGRIIGLDPSRDLAELNPSDGSGYLLRGVNAESAEALTDVALAALHERLRAAGAHLVVIVNPALRLASTTARWQVIHTPPHPAEVARARLGTMGLTEEQLSLALAALGDPQVKAHLETSREPAVGTEVAEELRHIALGTKELHEALGGLTRTAADHAAQTLRAVRADGDALALATSIALLERHDRTVIARCAAGLRPLLDRSAPGREPEATAAPETDVLGDDFTTRLRKVNAHPLPRVVDSSSHHWFRYWIEPIAFQRRHQANAVLSRLWLDYDGIAHAVLTWLRRDSTRYSPGIDYTAGLAIGRVLRQATGPEVLRQLRHLAESPDRWRRRLVAYALNEAAQDGLLAGAVRDQMSRWSRYANEHLRATVAETCGGGFGLIRPERTLSLLDRVLYGSAPTSVRTGVSLSLAVLLTESANTGLVFDTFTDWIARPEDTGQHSYALGAIPGLIADFLQLDVDDPGPLLPLVREALNNAQARESVVQALLRAEESPNPRIRARATALITALAADAGRQRGVRTLLVARLHRRARSENLAEGAAA
ncbi:hypothetical protein N0X72_13395 [Streptomyces carpaticus]|uniref:hypothetical protein n=1 Tax=Streptomyces carpaticus TaxID=285558 RepID=UPI00220F10E4|nr:hypothetical protein N0X72_13395 [Streptomyces carpaticus]